MSNNAEVQRSGSERTENKQPERQSESVAQDTFRKPESQDAQRDMLASWNTHTKGGNDVQQLAMTDPFAQANGGRTEMALTMKARGQTPGTDGQPPAGNDQQRPGNDQQRPGNDQQRSPYDQPRPGTPGAENPAAGNQPGDQRDLKDGVVKMHVTLPGTWARAEGSGFLVNTKGDAGPSRPGEQLIATADHVVEDRLGKEYMTGHNLFENKSELSKDDFYKRSSELLKQQDNYKGPLGVAPSKRDEMENETDYIRDHFNDISKVSSRVNPGARGITEEGLAEYRRENTKIDVDTAAGKFSGTIADRDPNTDMAVVRLSGLTKDQQSRMGNNQELENQPLHMGDKLNLVGADKTASGPIIGTDKWSDMKDSEPGIIVQTYDAQTGMSGGPARAQDGKVAGVNHAKDHGVANVQSADELRPLLNEVETGKIPYRKMPH